MVDTNSVEERLPAGSRAFLEVIVDSDGSASVSKIREKTTLSRAQVRYRFERLNKFEIIELKRDPSGTPKNVAPLKIAVLTEFGQELVEGGLLDEDAEYINETTNIEDRLNDIETRLQSVEDILNNRTLADHQDLDTLWKECEILINKKGGST